MAIDPDHPDLPEQLNIDIIIRDPKWEEIVPDVVEACQSAAHAAYAAGAFSATSSEAAVMLADDHFVAELNHRYRGRDGATNVLSFAGAEAGEFSQALPDGMPTMLGDIIVARETTAKEAENAGISVKDHLSHLVVHGMLHLLGYDHTTDEEASEMESLETAVLAAIDIENPYGLKALESMESSS